MECTKCDRDAIMHAAYSGSYLCESHFLESVERRVRRRIRQDNLLSSTATPEDPETWVIGISGGKDSAVLTHILDETFSDDPRVSLVGLTVHEGIEGYRDESLEAGRELLTDRDIQHEIVTYEEEFDLRMDDVVIDDPENMAACAYCGVFRRDILNRYAQKLGASKLLTGHNLDDEAQTALMNFFEGDVTQIAQHFDASLGSFDERGDSPFTPRAKPLRDIPEKEVALYAQVTGIPAHITECPHSAEAYRGEIQRLLFDLEERHPGVRHSIMAGYEELASLAKGRYRADRQPPLNACVRCGSQTTREICRKCSLVEAISG